MFFFVKVKIWSLFVFFIVILTRLAAAYYPDDIIFLGDDDDDDMISVGGNSRASSSSSEDDDDRFIFVTDKFDETTKEETSDLTSSGFGSLSANSVVVDDNDAEEGDLDNLDGDDNNDDEKSFMRGSTASSNIFAFQELTNLLQLVQRNQALATSGAIVRGGTSVQGDSNGDIVDDSANNPTACLPSNCLRHNNDIEQALQYLSRYNPGPTFTNLLFSACSSSRKLGNCIKDDDNDINATLCNEAIRRATMSAIDNRHNHLCNTTTLLGQCVMAVEISPAHRYCVVTAISTTANNKNGTENKPVFDLCDALNNFLKCVLQGATICLAASDELSSEQDANPENQQYLSQAFFTLVHRFRQNKIYFAEFGRSLGMETNQMLVNYALLADRPDEMKLTPESIVDLCMLPESMRQATLLAATMSGQSNKPQSLKSNLVISQNYLQHSTNRSTKDSIRTSSNNSRSKIEVENGNSKVAAESWPLSSDRTASWAVRCSYLRLLLLLSLLSAEVVT